MILHGADALLIAAGKPRAVADTEVPDADIGLAEHVPCGALPMLTERKCNEVTVR